MNRMYSPATLLPVVFGILWIAALSACRKDKPEQPAEAPITVGNEHGVYITNEGNFQWGNASVSYYNAGSGSVTEDLFEPANGVGLGDVCQSMCVENGKAYIVVNNSGKVVVVDPVTFVASATITGFSSPRFIQPVSIGKAYVTELSGNKIRVVDLNSNTITGNIPCAGITQEMALAGDKIFVTNESKAYVYVIDSNTDAITDSVAVSRGGGTIATDGNGKLWVGCTGGSGTPAALYRIDPQTVEVEAAIPVSGAVTGPWRLTMNGAGDALYLLNGGVYRMAITDGALPGTPFIAAEGRNLYGLGVDPANGDVYVADAVDYTQRGRVFRYTAGGSAITDFLAGRIPNGFVFR